jgi:predicted ATPase
MENFRSFNQRVELDFTAKPEKAGRPGYVQTKTGEVVSRVGMLIGPNASGKSNVLKALATLYWAIEQSAEQNLQKIEWVFQFFGNLEPVRMTMECSDNTEELYRYEIALTPNAQFVEERLSIRSTKRARWETLFDRRLVKNGKDDSDFNFRETTGDWAEITQRPNASLIGSRLLAGSKPGSSSPELEIARKIHAIAANSFGNVAPEFDPAVGLSWRTIGQNLARDEALLRQATFLMQNADIGIIDLKLKHRTMNNPRDGSPETFAIPEFTHTLGTASVQFPFNFESVGTRILLALFTDAYPVAAKSGLISLDEVERGIHPHLLPELVKALTPPDTTSQLLLVSHCDYLLRHLEHDQVFLTEKRDDGSTDIYRADDVEDFKSDRNLLNWYHAGKLGAIPRL